MSKFTCHMSHVKRHMSCHVKKILHMGDKASLDRCGQQQPYRKNPASKAKLAEKKIIIIALQFNTLHKQNFLFNLRPLFFHFFSPKKLDNLKSLDIGLRKRGKKTLKRGEQMKKDGRAKLCIVYSYCIHYFKNIFITFFLFSSGTILR